MQMTNRVLVIGLDGADWRVLQPYLDDGVMPNLAHLIEMGTSGPLRSTIPTHSAVAWVSFMTGQTPGQHGIFDFMRHLPHNRMRMVGVNSRSIRSETFFHVLGRYNRLVGAIHIPITYPPFPVNGFLLSGMTVPEGATYTYPEDFATELDQEVGGFPLNLMDWRFMLDRLDDLVDEAIAVTRQRAKVLHYLIENKRWDVLVQVFVSPDRLQHPLMHVLDAMHPLYNPSLAHQIGPRLRTYFATLDDMLGMARHSLPDDAILMVLSDHGFRSVYKLLNLKAMLKQIGMLNTRRGLTIKEMARQRLRKRLGPVIRSLPRRPRSSQDVGSPMLTADLDWSKTRAYTTTYTSQDIVINLKGREPYGIVANGEEYETLLEEIRSQLLKLRDPANSASVIKDVIRSSDLYHGPYLSDGPDLLIVPADGVATCSERGPNLAPLHKYMGAHRLDGIFVASGHGIKAGMSISGASLMDLAPTILYLASVPIPTNMKGQVLNLFSDDRLAKHSPVYQTPTIQEEDEYAYNPEEEREIEERLRGLGYL
jgi:predicted AlkP superfamily phosphohydrolase/phosphomutase